MASLRVKSLVRAVTTSKYSWPHLEIGCHLGLGLVSSCQGREGKGRASLTELTTQLTFPQQPGLWGGRTSASESISVC